MLKEYLIKGIELIKNNLTATIESPDGFKHTVNIMLSGMAEKAVDMAENKYSSEKILQALKASENGFNQPIASYKTMHATYNEIKNLRAQEQWADLRERFRYLLFRMLTAIGIAAVILGTGYIAREAGIPLPLLRMV